jgi:hypothetical protein
MRARFYCHSVRSDDDGRLSIHMSGDLNGKGSAEILMKAPFHAFEDGEVPRTWHSYVVTLQMVADNERVDSGRDKQD